MIVETLAVCDPAPVTMEGLRSLMASMGGPRVVAMVTNLEDAVRSIREMHPSVLLIDKSYGSHTVTDWLRILRDDGRSTAVIIWGSPLSEPEALRYFQAGAAGIIRKSAPLRDLWSCINTVVAGGAWMEHEFLRDPDRPIRTGRSTLTSREMQVMELVERGYRNREIGDSLGICTGTVKIHLKHIFEKTGIRGRYGLALSGLRGKSQELPELKQLAS
jgi:DNA-binding NarL/FixJ family response regulator